MWNLCYSNLLFITVYEDLDKQEAKEKLKNVDGLITTTVPDLLKNDYELKLRQDSNPTVPIN